MLRRGLARLPGLWRRDALERLEDGCPAALARLGAVPAAEGRHQGGAASPCTSKAPAGRRWPPAWRGLASKAEEYNVISVDTGLVVIEGYDERGFVVNGAYVEGAVMCSGQLLTLWRMDSLQSVTPESLSLLLAARPAPDLLVLGCGAHIAQPPAELTQWLAGRGVALELLDTGNAVSTYNILSQEGRTVVAALLPSR